MRMTTFAISTGTKGKIPGAARAQGPLTSLKRKIIYFPNFDIILSEGRFFYNHNQLKDN